MGINSIALFLNWSIWVGSSYLALAWSWHKNKRWPRPQSFPVETGTTAMDNIFTADSELSQTKAYSSCGVLGRLSIPPWVFLVDDFLGKCSHWSLVYSIASQRSQSWKLTLSSSNFFLMCHTWRPGDKAVPGLPRKKDAAKECLNSSADSSYNSK